MIFESLFEDFVWWFLIFWEFFHVIAHTNVLTRYEPPSEQLLRLRGLYFLWDFATAVSAFAFTYHIGYPIYLQFLSAIHAIGHLFYVFTWNKGKYAIRIMKWSSREYDGEKMTPDFYLTCADILTHSVMVVGLILAAHRQVNQYNPVQSVVM